MSRECLHLLVYLSLLLVIVIYDMPFSISSTTLIHSHSHLSFVVHLLRLSFPFVFFTLPRLIERGYVSVHSTNKTVYGESRNALHKELLRVFSPQLYGHLCHVELEPEYYAWDWFVQFFMGIFSFSQCCVLIDLFLSFSQTSGDFIFICLSVAILDEMRDVLMTVSR